MATAAQWIQGARLRTLPAAIAPVLIGTAAAYEMDAFRLLNAVLAALVALLLQIGVNYANDYSDGIRGTDEDRVGPLRLVGSGAASPEHVKWAAFAAFGLAMLFGLVAGDHHPGLVADPGGRRLRAGRLGLHRRQEPVRLPGPGRRLRVRVLRARGHARHHVHAGRAAQPRRDHRRDRHGPDRVRPADGQQRPRHPDRQQGREEDPGRAARGQACPRKLRADAGRGHPAGDGPGARRGRGC